MVNNRVSLGLQCARTNGEPVATDRKLAFTSEKAIEYSVLSNVLYSRLK